MTELVCLLTNKYIVRPDAVNLPPPDAVCQSPSPRCCLSIPLLQVLSINCLHFEGLLSQFTSLTDESTMPPPNEPTISGMKCLKGTYTFQKAYRGKRADWGRRGSRKIWNKHKILYTVYNEQDIIVIHLFKALCRYVDMMLFTNIQILLIGLPIPSPTFLVAAGDLPDSDSMREPTRSLRLDIAIGMYESSMWK